MLQLLCPCLFQTGLSHSVQKLMLLPQRTAQALHIVVYILSLDLGNLRPYGGHFFFGFRQMYNDFDGEHSPSGSTYVSSDLILLPLYGGFPQLPISHMIDENE